MKRYKILTSTVVGIVGSVFALGLAAAQVPAANASPNDISAGTYYFTLNNEPNLCINTHGVGGQLTVENMKGSGCAKITVTSLGSGNYLFQDANGHCLKADTSNVVYAATGSCSASDTGEVWEQTNNNPQARFQNELTAGWMKTDSTSPNAGAKVWTGTGGDNNWELITAP